MVGLALSEFRHRNNINNLNYDTLINEGNTLEFGGIKMVELHQIREAGLIRRKAQVWRPNFSI